MEEIYSNIGEKLCKLAKICGVFGIVCVAIGSIYLLYLFSIEEGWAWPSACGIILYGVISFIGSYFLYAFGQLTNDVHSIQVMRMKDSMRMRNSTIS